MARARKELPISDGEIFRRYIEEHTAAKIAKDINCNLGTVWNRIASVRDRLKKLDVIKDGSAVYYTVKEIEGDIVTAVKFSDNWGSNYNDKTFKLSEFVDGQAGFEFVKRPEVKVDTLPLDELEKYKSGGGYNDDGK